MEQKQNPLELIEQYRRKLSEAEWSLWDLREDDARSQTDELIWVLESSILLTSEQQWQIRRLKKIGTEARIIKMQSILNNVDMRYRIFPYAANQ